MKVRVIKRRLPVDEHPRECGRCRLRARATLPSLTVCTEPLWRGHFCPICHLVLQDPMWGQGFRPAAGLPGGVSRPKPNTNSARNRGLSVADDAERKLGGSAETPPHKNQVVLRTFARRAGTHRGACLVESRLGASTDVKRRPVSQPRSSNRTCGFPASGFPTGFNRRLTNDVPTEHDGAGAPPVRQTPLHR